MKKFMFKFTSLAVVLSVLLSLLTILPMAEGNAESAKGPTVVYNRDYEEGWDYENGFDVTSKHELDVELTYTRMSTSWYNYYMRISPSGDRGGYVSIPLGKDTPSEGKLFLEFSMKADADANIGGVLMFGGVGELGTLSHVVTMRGGLLYVFGELAGDVPTEWTDFTFTFDFDYAENTPDASEGDYLVTATVGGETYERVYSAQSGLGVSAIYIGAQENFAGLERAGDEYFVDDLRVYYGTDAPCALDDADYGYAVDETVPRDFDVLGVGAGGGYLSGSPILERLPSGSDETKVFFIRYFSEGWNFNVGFTNTVNMRENDFAIATDYSATVGKGDAGYLNYYWQFTQRNEKNGFLTLETSEVSPKNEGKVYVEFDIKAAANSHIPGIMAVLTPGTPILEFNAVAILNGRLVILGQDVGRIAEEWCHVAIEMDFDYGNEIDPTTGEPRDPAAIKYTAYVGSGNIKVESIRYLQNAESGFRGLRHLRIGRGGGLVAGHEGDWYGMDNLRVYQSTTFAELADDNYGLVINPNLTKDFPISSTDNTLSVAEIADSSLTMKVNSNNALLNGEKIKLFTDSEGNAYGGPIKIDGKVMVPLVPILDYTKTPYRYNSDGLACDIFIDGEYRSVAIGRDTVMIAGKEYYLAKAPVVKNFPDGKVVYICLDDVELIFGGFYVTYDTVGFISISTVDDYLDRDKDEEFMRSIMKRFVYDEIDETEVYDRVFEQTNGFDHPYIYTTQERFDYLFDVYHSLPGDEIYDELLFTYLDEAVSYADEYMNKWAQFDEHGNYVKPKDGQWKYSSLGMASWVTTETEGNHSVAIAPYPDTAGYDPVGGRLNVLSDGQYCLAMAAEACSFAWQITREDKYARFVYDWSLALCQWQHWAPGHYLNVGHAAKMFAVAYDFAYPGWIELGLDPAPLRTELHRLVTYTAWRSLNNLPVEFTQLSGYVSGAYWRHIGNWNPVCASGVLPTSLISLEFGKDTIEAEQGAYTFAKTIHYLGQNGFNYYGFDGSYRESAGYWCATIRYSQYAILVVLNSLGTDLGLLDAPGMDITNYFGFQVESSDYNRWNYHDDSEGSQPSYWLYTSAYLFDNPEFAALRRIHQENGKVMTSSFTGTKRMSYRWDAIWYDPEMIAAGSINLPLDYVMDSIDAVVSRSSWAPGSLYAGLMGGYNNVAHAQYDSGNWIYENGGVRWFVDLGADDYNLYGGSLANGYYKYSTEGNNTLFITSKPDIMPYGQLSTAGGEIVSSLTNEYGSATIIDNSAVYSGSNLVTTALRGMLVTNDRKTVVIQDEVSFVNAQDIAWVAHYSLKNIKSVELMNGARTAIMTSHSGLQLRVNLLTPDRLLKFEILDCTNDLLLENTPEWGYSASMGSPPEHDRSAFRRLVIRAKGVIAFDVAVSMELYDPAAPLEPGYKLGWMGNPAALQPMSNWLPGPDMRGFEDGYEEGVTAQTTPTVGGVLSMGNSITKFLGDGNFLTSNREAFFRTLISMQYAINKLDPSGKLNADAALAAKATFEEAKAHYDSYQSSADKHSKSVNKIAKGLVGLN